MSWSTLSTSRISFWVIQSTPVIPPLSGQRPRWRYSENGVTAICVQNVHDKPRRYFRTPETPIGK